MKSIVEYIGEALLWFRDAAARLSIRGERGPIADAEALFHFVQTRAALITQKKLYGYLKERMGLSYPRMFEDEIFARSINIAKMHVFAASLSDLTVYAVGQIIAAAALDPPACRTLALACYRAGLDANRDQISDDASVQEWLDDFETRLDGTNWKNLAAGASAFTASPKALIRWAPIADEHKKHDREIVENSIRFAWNEVREDLRRRLDPAAVIRDWTREGSAGA